MFPIRHDELGKGNASVTGRHKAAYSFRLRTFTLHRHLFGIGVQPAADALRVRMPQPLYKKETSALFLFV